MGRERRAEIEHLREVSIRNGESIVFTDALADLLADSLYWREAVKNVNPYNPPDRYGDTACGFCGSFAELHAERCAWLLAQQ